MDSPLLTSIVNTLAFFFFFLAIVVQSQQNVNPPGSQSPPPPPVSPPPPPPVSPPPPPPLSPPPPPPPPSPTPPPPPPPSPSSPPPPPPRKFSPPHRVRSPSEESHEREHANGKSHTSHGRSNHSPKEKKLNLGKKLGLLFVGIAALLQVFVVTFLVIKRRQLLRAESRL